MFAKIRILFNNVFTQHRQILLGKFEVLAAKIFTK